MYYNCEAQTNIQKICNDWNKIDSLVTIKSINKDSAVGFFKKISHELRVSVTHKKDKFVFPLSGFGNKDSIRFYKNGNDYDDSGYDYFQGSNSTGHPAHDIITNDHNKDLLDDITGKPVDVVSVCKGVVIAINYSWQAGSKLRGGKYVKVFDPNKNGFYYYSHLSGLNVFPGDLVNAGDKIGEVGRTGRSAILKEGSTHLHIGFYRLNDGYPEPEDILKELLSSFRFPKK